MSLGFGLWVSCIFTTCLKPGVLRRVLMGVVHFCGEHSITAHFWYVRACMKAEQRTATGVLFHTQHQSIDIFQWEPSMVVSLNKGTPI